mmetsp:Transcript_18808/g.26475  ORF Transcript_18808/g.26475 Transcript_18808/m.26475 type:complete len:208 (+) Transcript_18808:13-636(+)
MEVSRGFNVFPDYKARKSTTLSAKKGLGRGRKFGLAKDVNIQTPKPSKLHLKGLRNLQGGGSSTKKRIGSARRGLRDVTNNQSARKSISNKKSLAMGRQEGPKMGKAMADLNLSSLMAQIDAITEEEIEYAHGSNYKEPTFKSNFNVDDFKERLGELAKSTAEEEHEDLDLLNWDDDELDQLSAVAEIPSNAKISAEDISKFALFDD